MGSELDYIKTRIKREEGYKLLPSSSNGTFKSDLKASESGNRYDIINTEGYMGAYQFGDARLKDYKDASGEKFDNKLFIKDKKLQDRVFKWHTNDIKDFITKNELDSYIGKEINGVPVTLNGLIAVAHLGGKDGMKTFLKSDGVYNPSDSVGTSLTNYLEKFQSVLKGGYGHEVKKGETHAHFTYTRDYWERVFEKDFEIAYNGALKLLGDNINPVAVGIVTEMVYDMDYKDVSTFKETLKLINNENYYAASDEMLDSNWAHQNPERALRLSKTLRNI